MQVTFDPHSKEDVAIINRIIGQKGVIVSQPTIIESRKRQPVEIQAAILEAVRNGHNSPKKLRLNLNYSRSQLQAATRKLLRQRALTSTGHTSKRQFHAD